MKFSLLVMLFFLLFLASEAMARHLVFSTFCEEVVPVDRIAPVLKEAYRRIDCTIEIKRYPEERALFLANNGTVDGDLFRLRKGVEKKYPNLLKVPVSVQTADIVVFTKDISFKVDGWESLRPYRICFDRAFCGIKGFLTEGTHTDTVKSLEQAFRILDAGRTDLVLNGRGPAWELVEQMGLEGIRVLEPSVAHLPSYHYLHIKNKALLAPLTESLRQMEKEKMIQRISIEELKDQK